MLLTPHLLKTAQAAYAACGGSKESSAAAADQTGLSQDLTVTSRPVQTTITEASAQRVAEPYRHVKEVIVFVVAGGGVMFV